jgi:acyl transferase domain-containing protein/thioesterase domain-containing protein/acyl carrier protein
MVAVHLACQSLLSLESDMTLAGAVAVRVPHRAGYFCDGGGVVSPDGHVRSFDASANGTVFGSGGGILVLKRLADALAEGDTIHAVIKGSAVNNDGSQKAGYTAPSVDAQASAVVEALANAGVDADSISYMEAHGSGTPLGDPIEIRALTKAFRNFTQRANFCGIGSVKSNVGHLDAAAAVTGIIKTVLALKYRQLPASLHYTQANPEIDFPQSPFYVTDHLQDWSSEGPRRAGVMSTGMGGTNAVVILEEAPPAPAPQPVPECAPHLLVWSAKTATALEQATQRLGDFFRDDPDMGDVAHTMQAGRKAYPYRRLLVCTDHNDALAALDEEESGRILSGRAGDLRRPLVLLLPGVGDHYVGMAHGLYRDWPEFRRQVDHCAQILEPHLGADIRDILYPPGQNLNPTNQPAGIDLKKMLGRQATGAEDDPHEHALNQTLMAQPALFTIEYAMVRLWQSLGISPDAMVGHSMGEYVAACVAGVMTLEDALGLIATRARLVSDLPRGAMLTVMLPAAELQLLIPESLSISLINGPSLCVVAGPADAVAQFEKTLDEAEIISRRVQNAHAFHSTMMMPVMNAFEDEVSKIQLNAPAIPFISNVSGTWITKNEARSPAYWAAHLTQTARFSEALQEVWQLDNPILLEAGPGRTLTMLAMQHPDRQKAEDPVVIASIRHHYDNQPDGKFLCQAIGRLWLAGSDIQWQHLPGGQGRRKVPLPPYPFEKQLHWLEPVSEHESRPTGPIVKDPDTANWLYLPSWNRVLARLPDSLEECAGNWLLYADDSGLSDELAARLEGAGHTVVSVRAGSDFRQDNSHSFTIEPANPGHYDRLIRALRQNDLLPDRIIHAWSIGITAPTAGNASDFAPAQDQGFFSLIFFVKALAAQNVRHEMRLWVLSCGVQDVIGRETLHPERATLLAPCLVIRQEYPNIHVQSIDVDSLTSARKTLADETMADETMADETMDNTSKSAVDLVLGELVDPDSSLFVAHRNGQRWVQIYPRVAARDFQGKRSVFRHRGVYLITGGLGSIGMTIARHLAENYQARLTLVGRSEIPARKVWKKWTDDHGIDDPVSVKIQAIKTIEQLGGEVLYAQADVADAIAMRGVVDQTCKKFGALHGAIHGAGIVGQGAFTEIKDCDQAACKEHFQAKAYGLLALEKALDGRVTDFCMLLSSLTSVLGGIGQVAYAASNIFMDSFARKISRKSAVHWLSVNWDVWRLGDDAAFASGMGTTLNGLGMSAAEAAQMMTNTLALRAASQVVVSTADLGARIDQWVSLKSLDSEESAGDSSRPATELSQRPALQTDFHEPRSEIEKQIAGVWQEALGIDAIGLNDSFAELGGHSLTAVRIVMNLRRTFELDLPVRVLFDAPTVAELSIHIEKMINCCSEAQPGTQRAIVPLEPGGTRTPVFGVGGHNGDAFCYRVLARHLGKDQPLYGLQAPGLDGVSEPLEDIIELAGYYADQIRTAHPHGPVVIAGFCAGGTTAFELAQQLRRTGTEVECLVLLGAPWPGCYRRHVLLQIKLIQQWNRLLKYGAALSRLSLSSWWRLMAEKMQAQKAQRMATVTDPVLILRARVEEATIAAARRYVPEHYSGRVRHFLPSTVWADTRFEPRRWKSVAPQIEEQYGPQDCDDGNLLQEPWVASVARFYQS